MLCSYMSGWGGGRAVEFLQVGQILVKHLALGVQTTWPLFSCASVTLWWSSTGLTTGQAGLLRKEKLNWGKKQNKTQCYVLTEWLITSSWGQPHMSQHKESGVEAGSQFSCEKKKKGVLIKELLDHKTTSTTSWELLSLFKRAGTYTLGSVEKKNRSESETMRF